VADTFLIVKKIENIAVIYFNRPPVNALSANFRDSLYEHLVACLADTSVAGIVCCSAGLPFSAGADIKEFSMGFKGKSFVDFYQLLSSATKPVLAAIDVYALGGGLEFAMLCHYRVAHVDAMLGQPEIKLGIIPGGTGTQSLPRLVGIPKALDMMLTGHPIGANEASELGLIDTLTNEPLDRFGVKYLQDKLASQSQWRIPMHQIALELDDRLLEDYYQQVRASAYGFNAREKIIDCVQAACSMTPDAGVAYEQDVFKNLIQGPDTASLRYVFMQEQMIKRGVPLVDTSDVIASIGVVGGGLMGSGIAIAIAKRGYPVIIVETDELRQQTTIKNIQAYFQDQCDKRKLSPSVMQSCLEQITVVVDLQELKDVDLVIEAVFEDIAVKKQVFSELQKVVKPSCILATNTSSLDVNVIASSTTRPEQVVGMHFFSPAPIMKLVEVVRGDETSADTLGKIVDFANKIKKIPIVVGVCPGFVGNRMVLRYFEQVEYMLLRGARPGQIDKALMDFGFAMGPCAMADMSGLDISVQMGGADTIAGALVQEGRLGQKSQAGFYDYRQGSHAPSNSVEAEAIIDAYAHQRKITKQVFSDADIVERAVMALVDEAVAILDEGIVPSAGSIDLVYLYGYGFPSYRGGPMFYADQMGLDKVQKLIAHYCKQQPKVWRAHPLLARISAGKKPLSLYKRGT